MLYDNPQKLNILYKMKSKFISVSRVKILTNHIFKIISPAEYMERKRPANARMEAPIESKRKSPLNIKAVEHTEFKGRRLTEDKGGRAHLKQSRTEISDQPNDVKDQLLTSGDLYRASDDPPRAFVSFPF